MISVEIIAPGRVSNSLFKNLSVLCLAHLGIVQTMQDVRVVCSSQGGLGHSGEKPTQDKREPSNDDDTGTNNRHSYRLLHFCYEPGTMLSPLNVSFHYIHSSPKK